MQRDHDTLQKMICNLTEIGVNISKTKSRIELSKALEDMDQVRDYAKLHS